MGAASGIQAYNNMTEDQKAEYKKKFDELLATGKTEEEAINIVQTEINLVDLKSSTESSETVKFNPPNPAMGKFFIIKL